jgi:hypothetical protein
MAVPTISPITSILGFRQYDYWEYQMAATNSPTSWTITGLPAGMSYNATTGRISGVALVEGVFDAKAVATNGDGASAELIFPIGIEFVAYAPNSAINLVQNTLTGEVALLGSGGSTSATVSQKDGSPLPLFNAKLGDNVLLFVRFWNGNYLDLELTNLRFALKEFDTNPRLILSNDGFVKRGVGPQTYYIIHVSFAASKLKSALSSYEDERGTFFAALCEIERTETNPVASEFTPALPETLVASSNTFLVEATRDIAQ